MADDDPVEPGAELADREDVDRLYDLDPGEFVPARDALAKELRTAGDRPAAAAVRALRRPTVTAWALNQVARRQPDDVAALLEAAEAVGTAQAAAVGSGTPEALRAATRRRRELVAALARAATALAGPAHADEIEATLLSAGTDREAGAALAAGRLEREVATPVGFGLFGLAEPDPTTSDAVDERDDPPSRPDAGTRKRAATTKRPAAAEPPAPEPVPPAKTKRAATAPEAPEPRPPAKTRRAATKKRAVTAPPAGPGERRGRTARSKPDEAPAGGPDAVQPAAAEEAGDRAAELERRRQEAAAAAEALAAAAGAVGAAERELADATSALASARATLASASAAYSEASSALAELDG